MFAAVRKQSMCPSLGRISGRFLGSRTTDAPSWHPAHPVTPAAVPVPARGDSQPNSHGVRKQRGFSALPPSRGSDGSSVCPPLARWVLWVLCSSQTGPVHGAHPSTACASPPPCLCLSRGPGLCSAEHQGGELCWSGCLL